MAAAGLLVAGRSFAQNVDPKITTPKSVTGFDIGADYCMMNYTQISTLWQKWATESDRMKVVSIGTTAEGRPQFSRASFRTT